MSYLTQHAEVELNCIVNKVVKNKLKKLPIIESHQNTKLYLPSSVVVLSVELMTILNSRKEEMILTYNEKSLR